MTTYELFHIIDSSSSIPVSTRVNLSQTCSDAHTALKYNIHKDRIKFLKHKFLKKFNVSKNVRFRKIVRYALHCDPDLDNIGEMLFVCGFPSFIHGYKLPEGEYRDCWERGTRIRSYAHPMDKFTITDHILLQTYHLLRSAKVNSLPIPDPNDALNHIESMSERDIYALGW